VRCSSTSTTSPYRLSERCTAGTHFELAGVIAERGTHTPLPSLFECIREALQDGAGAADARCVYPEAWAAVLMAERLEQVVREQAERIASECGR
jgi:hypothetical protein